MSSTLALAVVVLFGVLGSTGGFIVNCSVGDGDSCPSTEIRFLYFPSLNAKSVEISAKNPEHIKATITDPTLKTKIIIHGFATTVNRTTVRQIRDAFLADHDDNYNVIMVDWGNLGNVLCYATAAQNVDVVGECTAKLIHVLVDDVKVALADVHVIGHSMGAQCAGATGAHYETIAQGTKLPHITGLDPAKLLFSMFSPLPKLDASDAVFVDVVHTNAGITGVSEDVGTVDFWMNDGIKQPHCVQPGMASVNPLCNHNMAVEYYAESIDSPNFYGVKCSSYSQYTSCKRTNPTGVLMGPDTPKSARGRHYVKTANNSPYALGPI